MKLLRFASAHGLSAQGHGACLLKPDATDKKRQHATRNKTPKRFGQAELALLGGEHKIACAGETDSSAHDFAINAGHDDPARESEASQQTEEFLGSVFRSTTLPNSMLC